ncbi:diacylglycerol O-acyltransferase 2-like [Porites lutea]|uniref:diacylglycerol O-acyltransferase 2-like n=1 Tax=Porites lutea TaxID=51062 RepID=UPI003CC6A852
MTVLWLLNYVLQTTSVAVLYVVGFTGPTFVLGAVTLYQLFRYTPLWPFVILYLSWVFLIDWKTPERGGRDLLRNFARRLAIFKYMKDYYPITLMKTSELDPQKNYIFGYHPHGFFTEGASIGFGTDACGFGEKFPGIIPHLAVHSVLVKAWLYRDMLMSLGIVDATLDSLKYVLTQMGAGHSIVLVVGGAAEVNNCRPDSYVLLFSRRKGFIKLALETGCDLVPVFAFGQNNLFPLVGGGYNSRFSRFNRWLYSKTHAGCVCCWGLSWCLPKRSPIVVVVGSPIPVEKVENPTQDTIDKLHSRYIEDIKEMYKKYVKAYHPTDKSELLIV